MVGVWQKVNNNNSGEFGAEYLEKATQIHLSNYYNFFINLLSRLFLVGRHLGFHIFFNHCTIVGPYPFLQLCSFGVESEMVMMLDMVSVFS